MARDDALKQWLKMMDQRGQSFCLTERAKVYAPTCRGRCFDDAVRLKNRITDIMGGSTVWNAEGNWYDNGKLIKEPVLVIEAAYEPMCTKKAGQFVDAIEEYIRATGEKAISIQAGNFYITDSPNVKPGWVKLGGQFEG